VSGPAARPPQLLAVPNVSEGADRVRIDEIATAFDAPERGVRLLDVHSDADHNRTVYTLTGPPGELAPALLAGAARVVATLDVSAHRGVHPRVGAIDVAPIVHLSDATRGAACAEALVVADLLAERLGLPVFLYGALTGHTRTRAEVRRGGPELLQRRIDAGELTPDFGPARLHPTAGAVLVAARPPLLAFNVELAPGGTLEQARAIAAAIREGGPEGLPGVRALGLWLAQRGTAQVSMNVEDHRATRLADVVAAIARHATLSRAEQVGLVPAAAYDGFPPELPVANRRVLEEALDPHGSPATS